MTEMQQFSQQQVFDTEVLLTIHINYKYDHTYAKNAVRIKSRALLLKQISEPQQR